MVSKKRIAVIGLGSMGLGMAQSLLRAGHTAYGFDAVSARQDALRKDGGSPGKLADIAPDLDVVVVVVLNAAQAEAVLFGPDGVVPRLSRGAVVLDCVTVPPEFAREMERRCRETGVLYVDAPISGGSVRAANGTLSIMASGTSQAMTAAAAIFDAVAENVFRLGDTAGYGSAMKAVTQLLAGVHIAVMAEALTFGMTQGIEPKTMVEVITKSAGNSWMFENRGPHVVDGDYTPRSSIDIWPKDLGIVLDIARSAKFGVPITAAALQQFLTAAGQGLGGEDDAAVTKVYARNANLTLPEDAS